MQARDIIKVRQRTKTTTNKYFLHEYIISNLNVCQIVYS